ncbi:hypothetical protein CEXT_306611 [Caerostris extrusa]|uniref:Uncharacterized protein n=1 Tax=Caerostris extrusa TaxID=172846 RepID=A0AAV4PPC0_CAEEX|nr:hypothetical protein CEXT_306611 [Caerostris extrusa]
MVARKGGKEKRDLVGEQKQKTSMLSPELGDLLRALNSPEIGREKEPPSELVLSFSTCDRLERTDGVVDNFARTPQEM